MGFLLKSLGTNPKFAEDLVLRNHVQVGRAGNIRWFGQNDDQGALEFTKDEHGGWQKRQIGTFHKPFLHQIGHGSGLVVFLDPVSALKKAPDDLFKIQKRDQSLVVLMNKDEQVLNAFLAKNPKINRLLVIESEKDHGKKETLDFFNNLKGAYEKHGITVAFESEDRFHLSFSKGPELER